MTLLATLAFLGSVLAGTFEPGFLAAFATPNNNVDQWKQVLQRVYFDSCLFAKEVFEHR